MVVKSAEEILAKWYRPLNKDGHDIAFLQIQEAMKEYAAQFINVAAEIEDNLHGQDTYSDYIKTELTNLNK